MTFEEYVYDRDIAVVGPAPLDQDQSATIDAHDLVYRIGQHHVGGWYGERCDIVWLNNNLAKRIFDDDEAHNRSRIDGATWWVYKRAANRASRPNGLERVARKMRTVRNVNGVTGILFDLLQHQPRSITVYGADLYAGGPEKAYYDGYDRRDVDSQARGFITHEPWQQMRAHREFYESGKIIGDDRYLAAISMPDDAYQAVIDSWQQRLDALT